MVGERRERAATPSARADYLRGDPAAPEPITRGRLELAEGELRFSAPQAPELHIDLADMEGLTVSGRSPYERPRRAVRGTMLVAARRNGSVDVWEFAVSRKAGAVLRDRINRELHARRLRRPPLPFVEQLVGPVLPPEQKNGFNGAAHPIAPVAAPAGLEMPARPSLSLRRPGVALVALAASAVLLAEILVPLLVLR